MPRDPDAQCGMWEGKQQPAQDPVITLLAEIFRDGPRLPASDEGLALCRVHPELHESADPLAVEAARDICSVCPMLDRCSEHVAGLSRARRAALTGVWAGEYFGDPTDLDLAACHVLRQSEAALS